MSVPFNSILIASRLPLALFSSSYPATVYITKRVCYCSDAQWTLVDLGNLRIRCIRSYIAQSRHPANATETGVEFAFVGVVYWYFVPQWRPSDLVLGTATNYNSGLTVLGSVTPRRCYHC